MTIRFFLLPFMLLAIALPFAAQAQRVGQPTNPDAGGAMLDNGEAQIAAVVNDAVISTADVRARLALALLTAGIPDKPEVRQHLLPQVLRGLIDEQLQLQEGKRLEINVAQEEIDKAMSRLAQDNRIPGGDMAAFLSGRGIPPSTMIAQARAILTWNKVVQRVLRPRVDIGDDEVEAVIERMRLNAGKQEFLVSEIYLPLDNPKDEDQVQKFAESLVAQIKGGTSFGAIARQFSRSTGASSGGDIGWIQAGQLPAELDKPLMTMQAGEISGPIRAANGYHILGVREKRTIAGGDIKEMAVSLQQAFMPFSVGQSRESILKEADKLRQNVTRCDGLKSQLAQNFPSWRWQDLGEVKLATAPKWLADKVRDVAVGHASDAMAVDKGALVLFVCNRKMPDNIDRAAITSAIGLERIELLARRLLRDLRRNAYIDIRLAMAP